MKIIAYKAFSENLTNKYGVKFKKGETYQKDKNTLQFGENGHGFHMSSSLADTFRYFNPLKNNNYCEVEGSGRILTVENSNYNAAPMYATEKMKIKRILTREEIIEKVLKSDIDELKRYINLFPFRKDELILLREYILKNFSKEESKNLRMECESRQNGNISDFKRNPLYLRKGLKHY